MSVLPMLGTLGYFGALALAPIFSWLGIAVGRDAAVLATQQYEDVNPAQLRHRGLELALRELLALWALCVAIFSLAMLWNPTCDWLGGVEFFAMGPLISGGLGCVCGILAVRWRPNATRGRQLAWGALPFVGCLSWGLLRLYFDPVVFAFDPFWGHFAGPIYDEAVAIGTRYQRFRFYNLSAAVSAWTLFALLVDGAGPIAARVRAKPSRLAWALASTAIALWMGLRPSAYGFHHTVGSISERLAAEYPTEHFVLHYSPGSLSATQIDDIAQEHEFAWQRLESTLGRAPATPVHSFLFDSEGQKRGLFGAGNVEVSTPWRGHIYLTYRAFPHPILHHELAHTFAGAFGDPLFGLSRRGLVLNVGLLEGVANALAPRPSDGLALHDQAAVLEQLDKRPPLSDIMGLGFWAHSASRAYTAAGSFCLWLLETEGAAKLMDLYGRAGGFQEVYGRPLLTLESEWLGFLKTRTIATRDVERERVRFERRSIFRRPCAHRIAELSRSANVARRSARDDEAIEDLREICALEANEPAHLLRLARAQASGKLETDASASLDLAAGLQGLTRTQLARIDELRADIALASGEYRTAIRNYEGARARPLREGALRGIDIKLQGARLGRDGRPDLAALILDYFAPFDARTPDWVRRMRSLENARALSEEAGTGLGPLGHYLAARQLLGAALVEEAHRHAELALSKAQGNWPSIELERAAWLLAVSLRARSGDEAGARALLDQHEARLAKSGGHRLAVRWWRERLAFAELYAPRNRE
jgi:hypothetical protein